MGKIGIIGGGFSGLGIAYYLDGKDVTIIESSDTLGGLANWIEVPEWEWPLERFVHHWFSNEYEVIEIIKKLGLEEKLILKDTKSSCYYDGKIAELDNASSLIRFSFINFFQRIRMGIIMLWLKLDKNFLKYEKITAFEFLKKSMGEKTFNVLWKPLFIGKFGKHAEKINAAWFWGRVHPRTKKIAYIEGGFKTFVGCFADSLKKNGTKILLNTKVNKIEKKNEKFFVMTDNDNFSFDALVLAVPLQISLSLFNFPKDFIDKYKSLKSIGAQYLILELSQRFLEKTYWLTINDTEFPFLILVEHTNYIDKAHYNNNHIIWVGKYLDYDDPLWKLSKEELLERTIPYLKKINKDFDKSWIKRAFLSRVKNAQHIVTVNYSKNIPNIETPIENLYMANMNQIYPFDRGTNNALILAKKAAELISKKLN